MGGYVRWVTSGGTPWVIIRGGMTPEPARRILFVEPSHGARSQMAAALLRAAAGNRFEVSSAGSAAIGSLDSVDKVLEEVGIRDFRAEARPISAALTPRPTWWS